MIEKLEHLSAERVAEVADFIDFLQQKEDESRLRESFSQASESSFAHVGTMTTMQPLTHYDFGDVILVGFPFTNLQTVKKRPADSMGLR